MARHCLFIFLFFTLGLQAQDRAGTKATDHRAEAIIKKAIRNKNQNDPQQRLKSFRLNAYNRLIVSANPDSVPGTIDTIRKRKFFGRRITKIDSTEYKFKKIITRQHLFETEKVSEYLFDGRHLKEKVLGTKMSGLSEPIYEILSFNLQSFSIYDDKYELFETKYYSPIARAALKDYQFSLLDSVSIDDRKTYRIYFRNRKESRKAGLEGELYIDSESFAIAKAVMQIKGVLNVSGTHEFEYMPQEKLWFPVNRNFKIVKGNNEEDIRILGGTIRFDAVTDENPNRKKEASDFTYLLSETEYSGFKYNIPLQIRKPSIAIEVRDEAINKNDSFWKQYRKDSLDIREKNTYRALDSLVIKEKIEKKLRFGRKIINGYIPFGPIDFDLRYLLSYNNYEGFRPGLGGITNDWFSEKYRIEGYTAYGTKDGIFKYNLGGAARIGRFSGTWIGGAYTDDIREIASTSFTIDKRVFKIYDPRPINVSTFYNHITWRAYIETKIIPGTESIWQLSQSRIEPLFGYLFKVNDKLYSVFHMTTAMVSMQWNPFSDYMQTPNGRLEIENRFPKFTFQYTQSLPGMLGNDFEFGKIDLRADYEKKYLDGQKTAIVMEAGYAYGDVPLTHLYSTSPNSLNQDNILARITLSGKNSFETMYFNEFFSSEYIMLHLKHGFRSVTLFPKIKPSLVLVTRTVWGNLQKPEQHLGINYKTLDKGYFESGIELNQIYKGIGLSGFYRYGPNGLPRVADNISIKVTFILNIGI